MNAHTTTTLTACLNDTVVGLITYMSLRGSIEKSALDRELDAAGFDDSWSVNPRTPYASFSRAARSVRNKAYTANDAYRYVVLIPVGGDGKDESEWTAHFSEKHHKAQRNVDQIASITWTADPTDEWLPGVVDFSLHDKTRTEVPRLNQESDVDYVQRYWDTAATDSKLVREDLTAFLSTFECLRSRFIQRAGKVDAKLLRSVLDAGLNRKELLSHNLLVGTGVYFVPHIHSAGSNSPAVVWQRLVKVIEAVSTETVVMMHSQFRSDTAGVVGIGKRIESSLSDRVAEVEAHLGELEDVSSIAQITKRSREIDSVLSSARLYSKLVGMKADELTKRVEKVSGHLKEVALGLRASQDAKKETRKAGRIHDWSKANFDISSTGFGHAAPSVSSIRTVLKIARQSSQTLLVENTNITIKYTGASYVAEVKIGRSRYRGSWSTANEATVSIRGAFGQIEEEKEAA